MSEEKTTDSPQKEGSRADRDVFLEVLIHAVEVTRANEDTPAGERDFGITLNVGGAIVTGTLISHGEFVRSVPAMQTLVGAIERNMSEEEKRARDEDYDRHFIHLKDARIIFPSSLPIPDGEEGIYWRGQLNKVDGWTVGRVEHSTGRSGQE